MIVIDSYVCGSRRAFCLTERDMTAGKLIQHLVEKEGCDGSDVVLQCEGRVLSPCQTVPITSTVVATLRLPGGKGGFGSMLRAIGAQIEKTTNREACRDLSGRRLRDINEEKRLKDFISKKAEREREIQERRRQKFEQLKDTPKHIFQDEGYYQQRETREKNLYDSLDKAFGNGSGPSGIKRATSDKKESQIKAKKPRFIDDLDESSDEDSDEEVTAVARESNSDDEKPQAVAKESSSEDEKSDPVAKETKEKEDEKPDAVTEEKEVPKSSNEVIDGSKEK